MDANVKSICGIILISDDVENLAQFYRDVLGLNLVREIHAGLPLHYGVDIAATHFGIHPPASFGLKEAPAGGSVLALEVDDLDEWLERLQQNGVEPVIAKHDEGFGPVAAIRDPDGNLIELVELNYAFGSPESASG